jgi:hypothetical protein
MSGNIFSTESTGTLGTFRGTHSLFSLLLKYNFGLVLKVSKRKNNKDLFVTVFTGIIIIRASSSQYVKEQERQLQKHQDNFITIRTGTTRVKCPENISIEAPSMHRQNSPSLTIGIESIQRK